jgi:ubiquitin-conjugating enzyme E2 M
VCLNILRDEWKPVLDINAVIYGIIYLFYEPNPNDPLNQEAAALFRDNRATFDRNVASSLRGGTVGRTSFPRLL